MLGVKDFLKNVYVPTGQLETAQIDGRLSADYELRVGDILTVRSNGNKQLIGRCILAGGFPRKRLIPALLSEFAPLQRKYLRHIGSFSEIEGVLGDVH